ncbi:MAG TPA: DUF374 domain-containing protein [Thermoanaerobaculia bacterium]|nr:DUF374 domain-containing protein [Thermoanaerobaculia bacterium]
MTKLLSFLGYLFLRALHATLRVRHVNAENFTEPPRYILAFWHRHILLSLHTKWRKPTMAIISRSKDGEIVSGVLRWYGAETARGSSTRGGEVALREILRAIQAGKNIAFTPDGPKGPSQVVKDGVIYVAKVSGLPIVPFAFGAKKKSCCARGTGWSSRYRSRVSSSSTARRYTCRATATRKSGARRLKKQ